LGTSLNKINLDLNDKQVKLFFTNMCNFYHEKTGTWITVWDSTNSFYIKEFYSKYKETIPNSIIQFWQATAN